MPYSEDYPMYYELALVLKLAMVQKLALIPKLAVTNIYGTLGWESMTNVFNGFTFRKKPPLLFTQNL